MDFTITQPLLRDRDDISNLAPLQMARTQLMITSDVTEAQIADSLVQAADQYWSAVQALDLAQKSYERDRHALQLGALPKLDIYQSEAQVARNSLRPRLDLTGQYSSAGEGGGQGPAFDGSPAFVPGGLGDALHQPLAFNSSSYGFVIQLSFPIRNSASEARLAGALVSHAHDDYQMRQSRQQVIQQVLYADNQLHTAQAQIEAARTARDLAAKNVQTEQQKYELGSTTIFEVLQAQVQLS